MSLVHRLSEGARLVVTTVKATRDRDGSLLAAGLAFYALMSTAPFVVTTIAIAGAVSGSEAARAELHARIAGDLGPQIAGFLSGLADNAQDTLQLSIASILGFVILFWSSGRLFVAVRTALHAIWDIERSHYRKPDAPNTPHLRRFGVSLAWFGRARLAGFVGTLCASATLLALLGSRIALSVLHDAADGTFLAVPYLVWAALDTVLAFVATAGFVLAIYYVVPVRHPSRRAMLVAASVTAALVIAGRWLFANYLTHAASVSVYGAAGAMILFLGWAYLTALIFIGSARLAHELDAREAGVS